MTDKKTDTSQDDRARSQSPVLTTPASKRVPPDTASDAPAKSRSVLTPVALVLALIAVGLSGTVWMQQRQVLESQARLESGLSASESAAARAGSQLQDALGRLQAQEGRIERMQTELSDAAAVIQDLDEALRSMTDRGSELVLLNDIDHLATIAQQQLQLGGNVRNAIVALESAQSQLARAGRPSLASLMQTVNGDLDRLRAASTIDVAAFSRQLEELAMLLTEAPLVMPDEAGRRAEPEPETSAAPKREQPAPTVPPAGTAERTWWQEAWETTRDWSQSAWGSLREDLGEFIDVRRVDDASALLMSPDQAARFRENLRTRVMTAQLALMMRQPEVWNTEMAAVVRAIETRYDQNSPMTRKALRLARGMADTSIDATLPTVDNTLQAINTLREAHTRRLGEPDSGDAGAGTGPDGAQVPDAPADVPEQDGAQDQGGAQEPGGTGMSDGAGGPDDSASPDGAGSGASGSDESDAPDAGSGQSAAQEIAGGQAAAVSPVRAEG